MKGLTLSGIAYALAVGTAVIVPVAAAGGPDQVILASATLMVLLIASCLLSGRLGRQWPAILMVLLAAIGLIIITAIDVVTSHGATAGSLVDRVCSGETGVNHCQQAFQSRWARVPVWFGVNAPSLPASLLGRLFYVVLLIWFVAMGRPSRVDRRWHLFPVVLTALGVLIAGYFMVILYTVLPSGCNLCLASHAVTALLFLGTLLLWPRGPLTPDEQAARATEYRPGDWSPWQRPVTAMMFALAVGLFGGQLRGINLLQNQVKQLSQAYEKLAGDPAFMRWDFNRQRAKDVEIVPTDSVRGPNDAPFTLLTYSDLQCPQCERFHEMAQQVEAAFPGRVRFVFRHFPLDRSCNPLTKNTLHAYGCESSRAAEAARLVGGDDAFWKMHDAVYAYEGGLATQPYEKLAAKIGLDVSAFRKAMASPDIDERILEHIESSKRYKVSSTPHVMLNGKRVRTWGKMTFWRAVLGPMTPPTSSTSQPSATQPASTSTRPSP